jgi:uncharacterized protein YggE
MSRSAPSVAIVALASLSALAVAFAVGAATRQPVIFSSTPASAITTDPSTTTPGIVTSGDATVSRRPDTAFVGVGVEAQASSAAAAQRDLAGKAARLIARAKALGLADKDINTAGYSIGPNYLPDGVLSGYRASEQLQLNWHNVDTTGSALDALVQEGGATNLSVSFGLADPKGAQAEARALAIADARARAAAMANAAGVRLGQVLRVSDYASAGRTPVADFAPAALSAGTQVPVGQLEITVTVEMVFAIA